MRVDPEQLRGFAERSPIEAAAKAFGEQGERRFRTLVSKLRGVYREFEDEEAPERFAVFINVGARLEGLDLTNMRDLRDHINQPFTLEVSTAGDRLVALNPADLASLPTTALAYVRDGPSESFVIDGVAIPVENPTGLLMSIYAVPVLKDLEAALHYYKSNLVRTSRCKILAGRWYDDSRLFFGVRPEAGLRNSLEVFLVSSLRDIDGVDVRPEQVVDESHPVDVKVTFNLDNREALIEIKWLGKSRDSERIRTTFGDRRARDGAVQLRDYLVENHDRSPSKVVRAYLIVVDARRRGLNAQSTTVDRAAGMYYAAREITYDPAAFERPEMQPPIRMFCEPKWT